ncbi:hypothetical protein PIB30_063406 [Stylosanthes scabra]|uniref:Uncharacterized protein n=1 Tax=Stylosanthes scabra TaxID=79078 RepID=A0ABU6RLR3_9FABA|nr:hypothetical protein [Stylosanthes scabra]
MVRVEGIVPRYRGGSYSLDELIKNTDLEVGLVVVIAPSTSTVLNSREMIVEDRIPNEYFDGSVKQKLDSAPWLVAGWLTSSLQKEISTDCKEVTKASVFCPTVGANVLVCSPERGPLQQQVLGKASKRADSVAQSLEPAGGGPARQLRRSSQQSVLERVKYKRKKIAYHDLRLNECIYRP